MRLTMLHKCLQWEHTVRNKQHRTKAEPMYVTKSPCIISQITLKVFGNPT